MIDTIKQLELEADGLRERLDRMTAQRNALQKKLDAACHVLNEHGHDYVETEFYRQLSHSLTNP